MEGLTLILVFVLAFCLTFHVVATYFRPYSKLKMIKDARRILLVVSHPDDETMFFGPTVLSLCRDAARAKSVFLLCLSSGDDKGKQRKHELYRACRVLGLPEENVTITSYTRLRDDPSLRWREEVVSEVVLRTVHGNVIDTVLTFDRHGVSGHKNHSSVYNAMTYLHAERKLPSATRVFTLRSVNVLRKYLSVLDLPLSFLLASHAYTASIGDWWTLHKAMASHASQYVWFRKLYMVFSRYNFINTFDHLNASPAAGEPLSARKKLL